MSKHPNCVVDVATLPERTKEGVRCYSLVLTIRAKRYECAFIRLNYLILRNCSDDSYLVYDR